MSTILTAKPDVNMWSVAGPDGQTAFNPTASSNPVDEQVGVPLPSPLVLTPSSATLFASIFKVGDGVNQRSFGGTDAVISQGTEGAVDLNNGVSKVTIQATFGHSSGAKAQRVGSIKGGCSQIVIVGPVAIEADETDWLIGQYSDQSQEVDRWIDLSGTSGRVIIVRGLFAYLINNKNNLNLGANCKLDLWSSLLNWCYLRFVKYPQVWWLRLRSKA